MMCIGRRLSLVVVVGALLALVACTAPTPTPKPEPTPTAAAKAETQKLLLATTTSTADTGLLTYLLPDFEAKYNAKVEVVAVGSGQAMEIGKKGDADVLLVHARAQEDQFVAEGYGVNRQDVMYNDFIILGPVADPAGIRGMKDAAAAFAKIAAAKEPFASRGDKSGTNTKELDIWKKANITPEGGWYLSLGQGMGETLTVSNEKGAYTLSDRGTYLSRMDKLELEVLVEGDKTLANPYGVIAVNPAKWPKVNAELATKFIEWLTSVETQEKIAAFKHASGKPLFFPDSEAWRAAHK
jgi:tungstate transport system substrate-binding protein